MSIIHLRRTVPTFLDSQPGHPQITINAMRTDPEQALLVVNTDAGFTRTWVQLGEVVELAGLWWRVDALTVGDRGSVVLSTPDDHLEGA